MKYNSPPPRCLNNSKASWLLSVSLPGSPHHKSIHPPKQEDLTTLSRALPHSKEGSPFLQTTGPYCLLYHTVLPVGAHSPLLTSNTAPPPIPPPTPLPPMPENNPHTHENTSTLLLSAWILYSRGANCIFYCFVAQWFFTRMLIWHFNKLCEWLQCCGRIAPICLTADPLSAPFSL